MAKGEIKYKQVEQWTPEYERQVLSDVARGNRGAFRVLYLHYYDCLFQFAMIQLSFKAAAEDAVETVFYKILKSPEFVPPISNFKSYIYSAVRNTCLNILKSGYISRRDDDSADWLELEIVCPGTPVDDITFQELHDAVKNAANSLPERCRLIFKLSREDRMSRQEIADVLGVKVSAVARQLMIAKDRIRNAIGPFIDKI